MKKIYSKLLILSLLILPAFCLGADYSWTENFNDLTIGNVVGQNGWATSTCYEGNYWAVSTALPYEGTKGLYIVAPAVGTSGCGLSNNFTSADAGTIYFALNQSANPDATDGILQLYLREGSSARLGLRTKNGKIQYDNNLSVWTDFADYSSGWGIVAIQWDSAGHSGLFRMKVYTGSWSDWTDWVAGHNGGFSYISSFKISLTGSATEGTIVYFDDITPTDPTSAPAPEGGSTGVFNMPTSGVEANIFGFAGDLVNDSFPYIALILGCLLGIWVISTLIEMSHQKEMREKTARELREKIDSTPRRDKVDKNFPLKY